MELLNKKTLSTNKSIKFATVLRFKEKRLPFKTIEEEKIYLLEVYKDFKIQLNRIDVNSLKIEKVITFGLGEFFGCPQKNK